MSVYKPKYRDKKTGETVESGIWWYHFWWAGRHIQESSKSARKTIATEAEKNRKRELEKGFNQIEDRKERVRSISELAAEYLERYKFTNPKSLTFAEYALGHVTRIVGRVMTVDVTGETVKGYQVTRLKEGAAPKSINEEAGFLLRLLDERGDIIRTKLRRKKQLKLSTSGRCAKAFTVAEKAALLAAAKARRSPSIHSALMLALHAGIRDAELRGLQWERVNLQKAIVTVGDSKTEAGEGRTIPLNSELLAVLVEHSKWFLEKFGETRPEWYLFPFGKPQPTDPTRPCTSFKTVWAQIRRDTGITGRWHDNRHTFITDLAESGEASDETIQDVAGHVSKQMLRHYSHIRMQAKRRAVGALVNKPSTGTENADSGQNQFQAAKEVAKVAVPN